MKAIVSHSAYPNFLKLTSDLIDTETGPGVLETALAYTSALRMADNAILFKYTAKSVGMKHGIIPSFMAKPWNGVGLSHSSRGSDFAKRRSL